MRELIEHLTSLGVLSTPRMIAAFQAVDRKDFVLPEYQDQAYEDYPLPIGYGQTISQPYTVAFMLELLWPKFREKILDVGSGSGWTTALLASCVSHEGNLKSQNTNSKQVRHYENSKTGKVVSIEIIPELAEFGKRNVAKYNFLEKGIVSYVQGSGSQGYAPEAPFDKILVSAAADSLPGQLVQQLKVGGILVLPVRNDVLKVHKLSEKETDTQKFEGFAFVPLLE